MAWESRRVVVSAELSRLRPPSFRPTKYTPGAMELIVPARISPTARERVRELALRTFARPLLPWGYHFASRFAIST